MVKKTINKSTEYVDEATPSMAGICYALINMVAFGVGLVLLAVGILYLTIYAYNYSLTVFSINLLAGVFIATGAVLILLPLIRIFITTQPRLYSMFALVCLLHSQMGFKNMQMLRFNHRNEA